MEEAKKPRKFTRIQRFNPEAAERVCNRIAEGMSVRRACAGDGLPKAATFFRWLATQGVAPIGEDGKPGVNPYDALREQYARARECRADARFESWDNIAAEARSGKVDAATARVLLDGIKWQTGKENAKKYGEDRAVTVKGDKDNPLQVRTARDLTDAELQALALGGLRGAD